MGETATPLPLGGFAEHRGPAGRIEEFSDEALAELNRILPWRTFTVDSQGRRIGDRTKPHKNQNPRPIPDHRVELADERFALADKRVLEIGSFEGVHTIALCERAEEVVAVDGRLANVVKTIVRCSLYDAHPTVRLSDVEKWDPAAFDADVIFHVGVLFHLRDPARHVRELGQIARHALLLDTRVPRDHEANESYVSGGRTFRHQRVELPVGSLAAGLYDHGKWLLLEDLEQLVREAGFTDVEVFNLRPEGDGLRVTILGRKPG